MLLNTMYAQIHQYTSVKLKVKTPDCRVADFMEIKSMYIWNEYLLHHVPIRDGCI